jgi:chorismate mutase/prephenate dehydratase
MTKSVENIRQEIESVDLQIHDLLIRRGELGVLVGAAKRESGAQIIRPDREAAKIRGLIDRHKGIFPKASIVRVWREIIGAVSLLQTDMKVAVAAPAQNSLECWDMARDYFGSVIPLQGVVNPLLAISMVREGEANFAVLPWPEDGAENPWWAYLASDDIDQTLRIMVRLPYGVTEASQGHPEHRAVVIAKLDFLSSDDDHSFLLVDLDQTVSRARVLDKMKDVGLNAIGIYSRRNAALQDRSLHLVEVDSFVTGSDARLAAFLEKLESPDGKCLALGGYPVLPVLND